MGNIEFKCEHCGTVVNTGAEYAGQRGNCPQCGAEIVVPNPADRSSVPDMGNAGATEPRTCRRCGKKLEENAAFCPSCGWRTKAGKPRIPLQVVVTSLLSVAVLVLFLIVLGKEKPEESGHGTTSAPVASSSRENLSPLERAQNCLKKTSGFSREGLIKQLQLAGCSKEEALQAVDACGANWNEQAVKQAKACLNGIFAYSEKGLRKRLGSDGFSSAQVDYALSHCNADWNEQALKQAKSSLERSAYSEKELRNRLDWDGFSSAQISYTLSHCNVDWNEQALKQAKSYLDGNSGFSEKKLREQLEYDRYAGSQILYAMSHCEADWNEEAVERAKSYRRSSDMAPAQLREQLIYEGFTSSQIAYALSHCDD